MTDLMNSTTGAFLQFKSAYHLQYTNRSHSDTHASLWKAHNLLPVVTTIQ